MVLLFMGKTRLPQGLRGDVAHAHQYLITLVFNSDRALLIDSRSGVKT